MALKIKTGKEYNLKIKKLMQLGLELDNEVIEHFNSILGKNDLKYNENICIEPVEIWKNRKDI